MLPYKNLLVIDKQSSIAVFRQIASQFVKLIQEGKLLPGSKLPSTRSLATDLQVHRKTITAAYELLVSEDWLNNFPRKGFTVSASLPELKPRSYKNASLSSYKHDSLFEFDQVDAFKYNPSLIKKNDIVVNDGFPDMKLFPAQAILVEYRRVLDHPFLKKMSSTWNIEGNSEFREALCDFLNHTRGIDINLQNLLTTRGAQMAIYVAASLIIKPGDKVIVSEPGYFFANMIFESLGAELIRVPVDSEGMNTEKISEELKKQKIKLIYVIPHHHHPTTVTMSVVRRLHLIKLIKEYNLAVIEDDYDYDFQFQNDPYLPLASDDHRGNIIYIGSLTKVLGTPFRLGYMVATERFIQAAAKKRTLIDLRGDVFTENVVSQLIKNGELVRLIQKANKLYRERCYFLEQLLSSQLEEEINFTIPNGGMALWLKFNEDIKLKKVIEKASVKGLKLMGTAYCEGPDAAYNSLRFGFASLENDELEKAVAILKNVVRA